MNDYIYVGKIVNTHGIKGELRIRSDFDRKNIIFVPGFTLYIGDNLKSEVIKSYRHHKEFDMVVFDGYDNINQVLYMVRESVYVKRSDLKLDNNDYVMEDLIDCDVLCNDRSYGKVTDYVYNSGNTLLVVEGSKKFYIPLIDNFIVKVDTKNKVIKTKDIEGLIL